MQCIPSLRSKRKEHWVGVIKGAKKNGQPFKVTELNYDDFYDLKGLQVSIGNNFQQNSEGEKINWNEIKSIKVLKEDLLRFTIGQVTANRILKRFYPQRQ